MLYGYGVDLLEHDYVLVVARDCKPSEYEEIPAPKGKDVRLEVNVASFLLKPLSETQTHCVGICNADPKLSTFSPFFLLPFLTLEYDRSIIPYWLINWGVKQMAPMFFEFFRNQSVKLPEENLKRIEENEEVYGELKVRVTQYFERKRKENQVPTTTNGQTEQEGGNIKQENSTEEK